MVSEAKKRASVKYIKEKTRRFTLQCHKEMDADIISFLESQPNYNGYLKALIRRELGNSPES